MKKGKSKMLNRAMMRNKPTKSTAIVKTKLIKTIQEVKITEKTIRDYLFGSDTKLTEQQQKLFIETAIVFQLNPFKREIYAIPYKEKKWNKDTKQMEETGNYKMNIVTGYEVYLDRAAKTGLCNGWKYDSS